MTFTPTENRDLQWPQIRQLYETTDVSVRQLAMQWGVASKTTLDRKIRDEGWIRNSTSIARHLTLVRVGGGGLLPRSDGKAEKIHGETWRREEDAAFLLTARNLASMQSKRMLRQLEIAEEIQAAGRAIIRHIEGVMTEDEDKVGGHLKRLISLCPDGEKLSTLVKSTADAIDRAVIMERRALGMEAAVPIQSATPDQAGDRTENAIPIVRKLDLNLAMKLREYTAQVAQEKRERRGQ